MKRFALIGMIALCAAGAVAQEPQPTKAEVFRRRTEAALKLIDFACKPEAADAALRDHRACALVRYDVDPERLPKSGLPGMLKPMGFWPVTAMRVPADGDLTKGEVDMYHPMTGQLMTRRAAGLGAVFINYVEPGKGAQNILYNIGGVIFPALCQEKPEACGMKSYDDSVFKLDKYHEQKQPAYTGRTATPAPKP